jgi:hypothetical protein
LLKMDSSQRLWQPIIRDSMVKYLDPFESSKRLLKRFLKPTTIHSRHGSRCLSVFSCTCAMWTKVQASGPVTLGGTDCISGEPIEIYITAKWVTFQPRFCSLGLPVLTISAECALRTRMFSDKSDFLYLFALPSFWIASFVQVSTYNYLRHPEIEFLSL